MDLRKRIEKAFEVAGTEKAKKSHFDLFNEFKSHLNAGRIRAAQPENGQWIVNTWVKKGILLGFRIGQLEDFSVDKRFVYFDRGTFPLKTITLRDAIRIVPGGSSIRDGCYIGKQVTCMPPMYINVGAYVDDETMIDSHALVGSCAQVGKRCHISAGSQIGGLLEPIGSLPVIIEDDVMVGGNCGVYEGVLVRKGAVIGAGTILTGSTPVYDIVRNLIYRKSQDKPLEIPENAVVVPGSRPLKREHRLGEGLSIYTPLIIKYKDEKSLSATELEDTLR